ncbi:MAG: MBL fold metallo-hydrolase [Oxalobacteraceae bacterium]|nr:MAG: MBL fold metallo-hydrolase [Oxalobacteraceae bacterium]
MALFFTSLNSGSNGNCFYIGNETDAILVDAGLTCTETEKRMKQLGLPMQRLRAIFVSHEHQDHTRGLATLAHKYQLPIYITPATAAAGIRLIRSYGRGRHERRPCSRDRAGFHISDICIRPRAGA